MVNEHEKAIQECERNAACSEYFNARPLFAAARESGRVFDAGFDCGWAAHARQPRNFCADCGKRTPPGSVHTCSAQSAVESMRPLLETWEGRMKESPPDADGWVPWAGGECPVDENTRLDVRYRDGGGECGILAEMFVWNHEDEGDDIVAYRVAEDAP